jgi:hypothetical protein
MAQRSPHNARYQKYTKPEGKTRRSAASAKPKRDAGSTTGSGSSAKGKSGSSARGRYSVPLTPEYKKWRNLWWWMLGGSAGCAVLYLGLDYLLGRNAVPPFAKLGLLLACYVFLGIGMYVDWKKVRPAREAAIRGESGSKGASAT